MLEMIFLSNLEFEDCAALESDATVESCACFLPYSVSGMRLLRYLGLLFGVGL